MDIAIITKLYSIFNNKCWHQNEGNELVFTNFCALLLNLTEDQQNLILELTERYNWITLNEYQSRLMKILNSIPLEKIEPIRRILLFPVMKPEDEEKTKSGHTILYMVKAFKPMLPAFKSVHFEVIESYEGLSKIKFNPSDSLFLLDDYLGSGETIEACVAEISKIENITRLQTNVVAIAAQNESIQYLDSNSIDLFFDILSPKGISDFYSGDNLAQKIEIMNEIEKLIPANHFRFGFNDSEALITLMKTPDNTFPIFWKEHRKNSKKFDAPFSRY